MHRYSNILFPEKTFNPSDNTYYIGILEGEGVGAEVIACALRVLETLEENSKIVFSKEYGGAIGRDSERQGKGYLSDEVEAFCRNIFAHGGALLNGPGGGRYVYEL